MTTNTKKEGRGPDAAKAEAPKAVAAKPEPAKPEPAKPDAAKSPLPQPAAVVARPSPAPPPPPAPALEPVDLVALPAPGELPTGDPDEVAPPPGVAPAGDARSLRGVDADGVPMFAVVYRYQSSLVIGAGKVGRRGRWHAVEYPSVAAASHAYAEACSSLTSEHYVDFTR